MLPVGCDLRRLRPVFARPVAARGSSRPLILWNQRWEYDKDPETMLRALYALADEGLPFRVALAGESFRVQPIGVRRRTRAAGRRGWSTTVTPRARPTTRGSCGRQTWC